MIYLSKSLLSHSWIPVRYSVANSVEIWCFILILKTIEEGQKEYSEKRAKRKLSNNSIDSLLLGEIIGDDSSLKNKLKPSEAKESLLSKYSGLTLVGEIYLCVRVAH